MCTDLRAALGVERNQIVVTLAAERLQRVLESLTPKHRRVWEICAETVYQLMSKQAQVKLQEDFRLQVHHVSGLDELCCSGRTCWRQHVESSKLKTALPRKRRLAKRTADMKRSAPHRPRPRPKRPPVALQVCQAVRNALVVTRW